MKKRIEGMTGHYVLAGFGRVGREASAELFESGKQIAVIDIADDNLATAAERGWPYIKGDAADDETLRAAGIERAHGLIVTTGNDATNLYIVMAARLLAPSLFIVSRAVDSNAAPKLERAGANRAVSPYAIGGRRMAHLMLSPRVVDFFETTMRRGAKALSIGEIQISAASSAIGRPLDALRKQGGGATILTVLRAGQVLADDSLVIGGGDHVLALGTDEQLEALQSTIG